MIAKNQTFDDCTVYLDGSAYYDCVFNRCTVVISGVLPCTLVNPRFVDCTWTVNGPAQTTLQFLSSLYKVGAHDLIEKTFDEIRGKDAEKSA